MKGKTTFLAKASMMLFAVLFSFTGARADELTVYDGTSTSNQVPAYIFYFDDFTRSQYVIPAADLADIPVGSSITSLKYYTTNGNVPYTTTCPVDVYLMEVDYTSMTGLEPKSNGDIIYQDILEVVAEGEGGSLTIEFSAPYIYQGGNLLIGIENTTDTDYKSINFYGQEVTGAAWSGSNSTSLGEVTGQVRNFLPKTTISFTSGSGDILKRPTGLKVSYEGGTEATVSWSSDEEVFDIDVNGTVTENVENPTTLTGLEYTTNYTVKVRAKRDGKVSDWSNSVSFTTGFEGSTCQIKLVLYDAYGDGWNGSAAIVITDILTNFEIGTYKLTNGNNETFYVEVPDGRDIKFSWVAGTWDEECSYEAYDVNENEIFSGTGALSVPVTYTVNCTILPWRTPTDLAASEITPTKAKLSWTENSLTPATSWVIAYKEEAETTFNEVTATENPYILEGLTPETKYVVKVRPATDDVELWSNEITFTTDVAFPAPSVAVKPTTTTASVTWAAPEGATGYNLQYTEGIYAPTTLLQYDTYDGDFTQVGGIGNSTANTWTWGVMYPGSMVIGEKLTKVSIFELSTFNTEDITINIYQGGDNAPGTLLYTETVTPEAADAFHEVTLASPVTLTPGENLWITLSEYGTYVITHYPTTEPNNQWVENEGWYNIGDLAESLAESGWMIRAEIGSDIDPATLEWTTIADATSPTALTDLKPETGYTVQVQAIYADGESKWTTVFFTTASTTDVPVDLAANAKVTTATLDWTGYQESYNLQYRKSTAAPTEPATIIFTVGDVWGDGSGYQMLLDADATAYGTIIPETGGLTDSGDIPAETYAEFEYKIPTEADGALTTGNIVLNNSITIQIPAGTYDWCITNPTPDDRMWIAASNGNVGGRQNDYVFEAGKTYEFVPALFGSNDGVDVTITYPMSEWILVESVTPPYELTGLTPETYYEWQVQGVISDATTEWSEVSSFTTGEAPYVLEDMQEGSMNDALLEELNGSTVNIQLADRVLYKDGTWNTICLPFDMDAAAIANSALAGADIRTLDNVTLEGESVTLNFTAEGAITAIEAGKPYIIKWAEGGTNTVSPIFEGVTIENVFNPIECTVTGAEAASITFKGTYDLYEFYDDDPSVLFVGENNQLNYPLAGAKIGACRGYFQLTGLSATGEENGVKQFILNFGDDATGIATISKQNAEGNWYDLSGRKVSNLNQKGIYVTEGRKVTVK